MLIKDVLRQQCSSDGLITLLLNVMSNGSVAEATQACRALGNICFDNGWYSISICFHARLLAVIKIRNSLYLVCSVGSVGAACCRLA